MCTSYRPATRSQLTEAFQAPLFDERDYPSETYQDYLSPIIRATGNGGRRSDLANFAMTPKRHIPAGIKPWSSMNCRTESVGEKRSFAAHWRNGNFALCPMRAFFEPSWETGRAVRWRIEMSDGAPFAVAALWRAWRETDGSDSLAMTLLTINADEHALLGKMHRPPAAGEPPDKRSLVIIQSKDYDAWLNCKDPEEARSFFRMWPPEGLHGEPDPLPPRRNAR